MSPPQHFETALALYTVEAIIGEGGCGRVFRVRDDSGALAAVKLLNHDTATRSRRRRFKNELAFAERNRHPNIITVIDHGVFETREGTTPFFVMPFFTMSVRDLMRQGIRPDDALGLFTQVLDGVEAAHLLGVIHRDLKPENLLFDEAQRRVVVADFGAAHFTEDLLITLVETRPGERLANFEYAAPEQRRKASVVDHRADVYALGLILHELFTAEVPQGTNCRKVGETVGRFGYVDDIVEAMRSQSAERRPQSIGAVKQQLSIRGQIEVAGQKLSVLKGSVVADTTIDDPLVIDPIRVEGKAYKNGRLHFVFQKAATPEWFQAFQTIDWRSAPGGKIPATYSFHQTSISVAVNDEREVNEVLRHFEPWIPAANERYRAQIAREQKVHDERRRRELKDQIERAERDQRITRALERSAG
jgi:serine/threonine protein kinase